jgi:hypothetical protein
MLRHSLVTCFQMYPLVLMTVVAGASVNIYAAYIIVWRTTRGFAGVRINMISSVYGCIVTTRARHAFLWGKPPAKVAEAWAESIQCNAVRDDGPRVSLGCRSGLYCTRRAFVAGTGTLSRLEGWIADPISLQGGLQRQVVVRLTVQEGL